MKQKTTTDRSPLRDVSNNIQDNASTPAKSAAKKTAQIPSNASPLFGKQLFQNSRSSGGENNKPLHSQHNQPQDNTDVISVRQHGSINNRSNGIIFTAASPIATCKHDSTSVLKTEKGRTDRTAANELSLRVEQDTIVQPPSNTLQNFDNPSRTANEIILQQGQGEQSTNNNTKTNHHFYYHHHILRRSSNLPVICEAEKQEMAQTPPVTRTPGGKTTSSPALKKFTPTIVTPRHDNASPYDVLEAAVVEGSTPPATVVGTPRPDSSSQNSMMDMRGEIMEQKPESPLLSNVESPLTPSPPSPITFENQEVVERSASSAGSSPNAVKKTPIVRATKASQARIQLAHNPGATPRAPAWGPPRNRQSIIMTQRIPSLASDDSSTSEKKEVAIPHSKPRPMSMSFPAPPALIKSNKPATRPTFQLPGEIYAAKLKAEREERQAKEAANQKTGFKARPMPKSTNNAPAVRQTKTSSARGELGLGKNGQVLDAQTGRRSSMAVIPQKTSTSRPTSSDSDNSAKFVIAAKPTTDRPSTSLANISKPRIASPADAPADKKTATKGTSKGREVFNRTVFANITAEQEKRQKEEATKKARAEAAERSRILSREWAEKKRREKMTAAAQPAA